MITKKATSTIDTGTTSPTSYTGNDAITPNENANPTQANTESISMGTPARATTGTITDSIASESAITNTETIPAEITPINQEQTSTSNTALTSTDNAENPTTTTTIIQTNTITNINTITDSTITDLTTNTGTIITNNAASTIDIGTTSPTSYTGNDAITPNENANPTQANTESISTRTPTTTETIIPSSTPHSTMTDSHPTAVAYTYEVKVQMNVDGNPMDWIPDLQDPSSDAYKTYSKLLCDFFMASAKNSPTLKDKNVTCNILAFLRGSAYGVAELVVKATSEDVLNTTCVRSALEEGAKTYMNSVPTVTNSVSFSSLLGIVHVSTEIITVDSSTASSSVSPDTSTTATVHLPPASSFSVYRLYGITVSLEVSGRPMEWDTRLEDSQSEYYKNISASVCTLLLKVAQFSGSEGLRRISCNFRDFHHGSVRTSMDVVAETLPSVAPTEWQLAQSLIGGIQNYFHSDDFKDNGQFNFSLYDPIQVTDNTPNKICATYSSRCSVNARCEDHIEGYRCSCKNFWSDRNPEIPGTDCRLNDGAIALIIVAILVLIAVVIFVIVAAIYLNRYRYA
ncbi:hypothetical protein D915_009740 [Fasciola hepatica]|uniref:EGF-like domain-containing protein n=1 Tax=Fasciola hepatica TaxID=6192 RepID=A0A4E0RP18_FASHE|nr:hypothetical protein D915_009740 [Fasciola hepatica]